MKRNLLLPLLLISVALFLINATTSHKKLSALMIENSVAKISPTLYAGKFEVSNRLYRMFLADLKQNNRTEDLKIASIDTAAWVKDYNYGGNNGLYPGIWWAENYHSYPTFADYPVVNISYEGANLFCKWLTEKYNAIPGRKYKNVVFRLPNEQEWCLAGKGGLPNPVYSCGDTLRVTKGDDKGEFMCYFYKPVYIETLDSTLSETLMGPVKSYWVNGFGISNMSGNVAEMVEEKGICKGGSYATPRAALRIDAIGHYNRSACDLGFRYFMEIKNK